MGESYEAPNSLVPRIVIGIFIYATARISVHQTIKISSDNKSKCCIVYGIVETIKLETESEREICQITISTN